MPTAGRLAAASAFFIYGWYIGILLGPFFPEGNPPGFVIPLCIIVAFLVGWVVVGSRAGRGYSVAVANGLTGVFAFAMWILFLVSFQDMIDRSLRRRYDGPMEAVVDVFSLMLEYAQDWFDANLIISVVVGGILCSFFAEYFAKRYP